MKYQMLVLGALLLVGTFGLMVSCAPVTHHETREDVQIDVLVASSRTKADELQIASMYRREAKAETDKAQAAKNQAEAYKTHKNDFYTRRIYGLIEHCDAVARHYQDAAEQHNALAKLHEEIAAEMTP